MAPRADHKGPSIVGLVTAGVAVAGVVGLVREKMRSMDLQDVLEATEYEVRFLRERTQELTQENERLKARIEELEAPQPAPAEEGTRRARAPRTSDRPADKPTEGA